MNRIRSIVVAGLLLAGAVPVALGSGALAQAPAGPDPASSRAIDDEVRLNEIQVVGSHNSYKRMVSDVEQEFIRGIIGAAADLMAYEHEPLITQFTDQRVRQIELDVFVDTAGGKYENPALRQVTGLESLGPPLDQPGTKVLHIQDVDYASTCPLFTTCLEQIKTWSDQNPHHVPIAVLVEMKDSPLVIPPYSLVLPDPWTAPRMDELDAEIRSVFPPEQLIVPDDVRGAHATLPEALAADGWPTLGESRGRVMFLMDNSGGYRSDYLAGHPALEGRVLFTSAPAGAPDAAFIKMNDPTGANEAAIQGYVADGYVVRTRADGDTVEARANDTTQRDAALRSGAQWVSTDYPMPDMGYRFETDYYVQIPGGTVARCNPVNAPETCVSADLEVLPTGPPTPPTTTPPTTTPPTTTTPGTTPPGGGTGVGTAPAAQPVPGTPTYTG